MSLNEFMNAGLDPTGGKLTVFDRPFFIGPDQVIAQSLRGNGKLFYVDVEDGSDTNDGLTPSHPFATIAAAVAACVDDRGDVILVKGAADGVALTTTLTLNKSGIVLVAAANGVLGYSLQVALDCSSTTLPTLTVAKNATIVGFLFTSSNAASSGSVVTVTGASVSFSDCTFDGSDSDRLVTVTGGLASFARCRFMGSGIGLALDDATPMLYDCHFATAKDVEVLDSSELYAYGCDFAGTAMIDANTDKLTGGALVGCRFNCGDANNIADISAAALAALGVVLAGNGFLDPVITLGDTLTGTNNVLAALMSSGTWTYPTAAAPANNVSVAAALRYAVEKQSYRMVSKAGATVAEATTNLFTVTGCCEVKVIGVVSTTVARAGGAVVHSVGTADKVAGIIPACTDLRRTAGKLVGTADENKDCTTIGADGTILVNAATIIQTLDVAADSGAIDYYCFYRPISSNGAVAAA